MRERKSFQQMVLGQLATYMKISEPHSTYTLHDHTSDYFEMDHTSDYFEMDHRLKYKNQVYIVSRRKQRKTLP